MGLKGFFGWRYAAEETITKEVYCETLFCLWRVIQPDEECFNQVLCWSVVMPFKPHYVSVTKDVKKFISGVFVCPSYIPDVPPLDLHMSWEMKAMLCGQMLLCNEEFQDALKKLLCLLIASFFAVRIKKHVSQQCQQLFGKINKLFFTFGNKIMFLFLNSSLEVENKNSCITFYKIHIYF